MKKEYDFRDAKRGSILPVRRSKSRITIRVDDDVLDWFRAQVHAAGGGNYQTLINDALRTFIVGDRESIEAIVRRAVRDALRPKRRAKRAHAA